MRIKIDFLINDNFKFSKDLNEAMTAFIYRCINISDKDYAKMLHDKGISGSGYKKFVYHAYSFRQGKEKVTDKLNKGIATLIFSSLVDDTIKHFLNGLTKIGKVQLLAKSFEIRNVQYLKDKDIKEGIFRLSSPIFIEDIKRNQLTPCDMPKYIENNLIQKYYLLNDKLPEEMNIEIKFLDYQKEIVNYKGSRYNCYFGNIAIKGSEELINVAYKAGIGTKNGLGLGLLERI